MPRPVVWAPRGPIRCSPPARPEKRGEKALRRRGCSVLVGLLVLAAQAVPAGAQQNQIAGVVLNANTNQPLSGAQISIVGANRGTISQTNGRFLLLNVTQPQVTLEVVMIGFRTWTDQVQSGTTDLQIRLEQRAVEMDEIVVTGTPGEQQVRSLGNAVSRVRASDLEAVAPSSDVESLLSGAVPGLNVAVAGGEVGNGANIRIRGASSVSLNSQPLLYIDGVRVNGNNADSGGGVCGIGVDCGHPPSRLNDINPDDIESIEVIKGPAAATLYGTEASNGVINVITKRGSRGAPRLTLTIKQGANWYPDPEEFFPTTAFRCQGTSGDCTAGEIVDFNVLREDRIRNGDEWFRTGKPYGIAGSVSGGSDEVRYYFSLDWDRDEGVVPYNWQNRLSGRGNLNWTASEDLDINLGISGVRSKLESSSANQPITTAINWSCPAPGCEEGSGLPNAVDGAFRGYIGYLPDVLQNKVDGFQEVTRNTFNLTLNHRPFEWLDHRFILGADYTETTNDQLYRPIQGVGHFNPQGQKDVVRATSEFLSVDYSATATVEPMEGYSFATSGGIQFYQKKEDWVWAQGENFPVPALETVTSGAIKDASEDFLENKTLGAYVQERFGWQNRLFLTAAVRGDDNSAFGENFDFVVYPKFSASWVVSEEAFMQDFDWVNQLKVRGAWGQAGQQPDVFAALRTFEPTVGPGGESTITPQNIGNPDLEPEVGQEWEAGFDASLLDDRLGVEFTYYNQIRKDAIVRVPVKPSLGFPGIQFQNIGEIKNTGIELALNGAVYQSRDVGLDLSVNFYTNDNELTDMGGLPPQPIQGFNPTTGWARQRFVEGFPLGAIFLKRVVSADIQDPGTPDAVAINAMCEGGSILPGTENLSAGGGSPVPCDEAPEVFRGAPIPTRELSTSATLTLYRDLQLYAQVDYQGGHEMIDGNIAGAHMFFRNTRAILERTDPILLAYESLGRLGINQAGLINASFAKLRRISASYTFPQDWAGTIGADRLNLTVSAHNLWTIYQGTDELWGYPNLDPEMRNTNGTTTDPGGLSAYNQEHWPTMKRFLATLRVTF